MKIDETDNRIINELIKNPRSTVRDIAKKTNVSAVTILKRMKILEKEKIIKSYTAMIDYSKIGYDLDVIVKIRVSKGKLMEVGEKIAQDKNVLAVYDITGDFDIITIAKFKSRKALDGFVKKIQTFTYVERTETILILNTLKEERMLSS